MRLSHKNHSINLQCKSIDSFPYGNMGLNYNKFSCSNNNDLYNLNIQLKICNVLTLPERTFLRKIG